MDPQKFEDECFHAHNAYRKAHGVGPLEKDPDLTKEAQHWAEQLTKIGKLEHSDKDGLGENIAYRSGRPFNGFIISKMWYDEVDDYSFSMNKSANGRPVGHFTQIVWKNTEKAGFGVSTAPNGRIYACGNYTSQGNVGGQFKENVLPKSAKIDLPQKHIEETGKGEGERRDVTLPADTGAPTPGTTETRKTEIFTQNNVLMKKTIITTTTVVETPGGGWSSSTSSRWEVEVLDGDEIDDEEEDSDSDEDIHDGVNDMSKLEAKSFRKSMLKQINRFRRGHGAPKLKTSKELTKDAQKHALKMLKNDQLIDYSDNNCGQTLAVNMPRPRGDEIALIWYDENEEYDYINPISNDSNKNFTQLVWSGSEKIGVGVASNKEGETYVIALYQPKGNIPDQFKEKVN
ncbi:uncharacterized protein LOC120340676 [Styela clava]